MLTGSSLQDTNGDVDSANGSPVTEPGGETSLASHEHVGNCEAKDIAVMPLHAKVLLLQASETTLLSLTATKSAQELSVGLAAHNPE